MKFLFPILMCIPIANLAQAALFTNSASADAFVRAAAPTSNYGGGGALSVSGTNAVNSSGVTNGAFDSFIRFSTSAMVTNFNSVFGSNNWIINGAKLWVTELGAPPNAIFNRGSGSFEIRWIANTSWVEGTGNPNAPTTDGIAYNSEPTLLDSNADVSLGVFTNAGVDGTLNFRLALPAAFVSNMHSGTQVGFYLTAIDPRIGFTFDSRSFTAASARPYLEVSTISRPGIGLISLSGTDIMLLGTNGVAGGVYKVLSSSNVALPLSQWVPVATNMATGNGEFMMVLTNAANTGAPESRFFMIGTQ